MNRVGITGMGIVCPLGNDLETVRNRVRSGESGVGLLDVFPVEALDSRIAGQCMLDLFEFKDRKIDFALNAGVAAVSDAGVGDLYAPESCGLSIGLGLELFDMNDMAEFMCHDNMIPDHATGRMDYLQTPADACVTLLSERFSLRLPPLVHVSACAAGSDAIGHAALRIRNGSAKMMLAGGTDSMINPLGVAGFCKLSALSTRNDDPQRASRPFDRTRDGFVLGEGAGFLVLENLDDALRRGANVYAEIAGFGNSFDAHSVSEPHPEGRGAALAIRRALDMAGIEPTEVSMINAHGTSTPKNDPAETNAIKSVFGEHAYRVPISSTKSMIGHLIGAAGAVEAVVSTLCAQAGFVHPTINLETPDPACDLDYVPLSSRECEIDYYLSNSFAFGGQNAALVFKRWRG